MSDDLIKRLRQHRYNTWNDDLGPEPDKAFAADRIEQLVATCEQLERELDQAVAGLKPLVQICEMMRDGSGFRKGRYQHEVTDSQWSAWCKQVKTARAVLAELEGKE